MTTACPEAGKQKCEEKKIYIYIYIYRRTNTNPYDFQVRLGLRLLVELFLVSGTTKKKEQHRADNIYQVLVCFYTVDFFFGGGRGGYQVPGIIFWFRSKRAETPEDAEPLEFGSDVALSRKITRLDISTGILFFVVLKVKTCLVHHSCEIEDLVEKLILQAVCNTPIVRATGPMYIFMKGM